MYNHRLLTDPQALAYVAQRGIDRVAVQNYRIGYAAGDELMPYLRWRRLPLGPALRVGLLNHAGREFLAGRIVVPELRDGHPVWLVGRILEQVQVTQADEDAEKSPPKYLALRGSKPLLGWEHADLQSRLPRRRGVVALGLVPWHSKSVRGGTYRTIG